VIPFTKEEFEDKYDIDVEKLKYYSIGKGLNFSYTTKENEKRLLLCEYYEKQKKYKKLLMMAGGLTVYDDDLDAFHKWFSQTFPNKVLPQVIKDRKVETNIIHFYRFIEDKILEHRETDFPDFPLVYFDGNSVEVRGAQHADKENDGYVGGDVNQYTRPYMWHALGVQKFKNYGLQCLANEFENMPQHKWIAPMEGMIEDYKDAYINPQIPTTMLYRQFMEKDPTKQLNPPAAVQRPPIPPEIAASIQMSDQMMQTILGSYDAALGINNNELSGIAIVEAATQSNAAAMPYIVSFLQGLNSVANLMLKLIPKYYVTPRTIPIINNEGQHDYIQIEENTFKFSDNSLNVKVEAGANFAIQKDKQMKVITALMQTLPTFAQFVDQAGIPILLENLEINGIDKIIAAFKNWQQQNQQAMQQQQQQQAQMNPQFMNAQNDAQRLQIEQQQNQAENQLKAQELQLQQEELNIEQAKVGIDAQAKNSQSAVQVLKAHTEQIGQATDLAMKNADMQHRHEKERIETASKVAGQMMPKVEIGIGGQA
jgi:hypothetical protein